MLVRKKTPTRKEEKDMTRAQELTIEKIKKEIPRFDFYSNDDEYEIKQFEVEENEYFVSVYFVTGRKNDEGTMAVFFRKYRHAFIGKNGGIRVPRRRGKTCFRSSVFDFMNKHYYH